MPKIRATWVEEKEDTPEAFALFARLFVEELGKIFGKMVIKSHMLALLKKKQEATNAKDQAPA